MQVIFFFNFKTIYRYQHKYHVILAQLKATKYKTGYSHGRSKPIQLLTYENKIVILNIFQKCVVQ